MVIVAGNDFSGRFPFIATAVAKLSVRSCLIDGEAIVCDENGLAVFEPILRHGALASAVHSARHWVKVKNPNAPAVKREAEDDWGSPRYIKSRKRAALTREEY